MTAGEGDNLKPLASALGEYLEQLSIAQNTDGSLPFVPTGYIDLDKILGGGLQRSDLIVLAARPSLGKSSLALGIAVSAGLQFGATSAILSLEMSGAQVAVRLLAMESGVEASDLRSGRFTEIQQRRLGHAIGVLAELPLHVVDQPEISTSDLRTRVRGLHAEMPLDLVVIDRVQLVSDHEPRVNALQSIVDVARELKQIGRELNVPMLVVSELPDSVEQRSPKLPTLADLDEYGSLREAADVVMFLYRDDYYNKDSEKQGIAEIHIAKHRSGPTGRVSLLFNQRTAKFLDLELFHEPADDSDD